MTTAAAGIPTLRCHCHRRQPIALTVQVVLVRRCRGEGAAPPSYCPRGLGTHRSCRRGGDQSAPSRESAPRKPPTTARITTAVTNSSAAMSDPLPAAGGAQLAGGPGLAAQVIDV